MGKANQIVDEDSIIQVENLTKVYEKIKAVCNVSFDIKRGEVFGLIGPDGAGKTSIIQILAGVLSASAGKVIVAGVDVIKNPENVKDIIGYMPQGLGLNLYDNLTVEENIDFFRGLRKIPQDIFEKNKKLLLEITRLSPFLDRQAKALSGGMRQKLALICTLLHLPDIILLDEPTTGVDPLSRQDFWDIIYSLVKERKITVLLSTSYMDEAERCHRVALMHECKFIFEGEPDKIGNLEDVFIEKISGKKDYIDLSLYKDKKSNESNEFTIVCDSVSKVFGNFKAVDSVNLQVKKGEILGLLGPNGAGKTTLIKMMCGLSEPTTGKITVAGFDVHKEREKVWPIIGYMSQKFSLYKDLTVIENIKLYAGLYGVKNHNYFEIIKFLGLEGLENRLTKDIPFGMRQRVSLACAIFHNPKILFLDEPTSGVDPVARRKFWEIIYKLSREKGTTIIVSTHYMDEAEYCDKLGLMHKGRLIAEGTPEELKEKAKKLSGSLIQVKSKDFYNLYNVLKNKFKNINIYGKRIFIRSFSPEEDIKLLEDILKSLRISDFEITQISVPLQEAFVDFIRASENNYV